MLASYPYITNQEFDEACQILVQRFQGKLDSTDWIAVNHVPGVLHIRKSYAIPNKHDDDDVRSGTVLAEKSEDDIIESEDHEALARDVKCTQRDVVVDFSITLSPTYQVPVLWFTFSKLLAGVPADLDAVYANLIPDIARASVGQVGVMGGISMAHHPISDLPAFFIHPCNTVDALQGMRQEHVAPEDYLKLWLGLVGPTVSLYIPSKVIDNGDTF